ncbi:hypothetical protein Celaphus_00004591, partial [Cervus elaphus hippelaphus]
GTSRGVTWLRVIGAQDVRVQVAAEVRGNLGDTVELPCHLLPSAPEIRVSQPQNHVEKQEVTFNLDPVPVARCVSAGGRPPARVSWLSPLDGEAKETQGSGPLPGTVTVTSRYTVTPLSEADGVKVICKVEHESFQEPKLLPVTISGYDDNWYIGRSEATLNCNVRSKPEPTGYDWSTTSGVFPASAVAQGPKLIVHSVDRLFNTTFICTVTNAVGTGQAEQVVLVRETPNTAGAGATGGIIGGIIAAIIATAVAATGILICRQQRKEQRLQGAEEEEDPPSSSPLGPRSTAHSRPPTLMLVSHEMPRYHELPTLEERSGPLIRGATSLGSPIMVPPGPPAVERVSLDLEEEEEEEDYLDKINPIYDALSYSSPSESYQGKGFVMSRAMYV